MDDKRKKEQRSRNMSAIRSKGNKSTELHLLKLLRNNKITGWRRHYKRLLGTPDFVFVKQKVAIFLDGCFWHGCKKCYIRPKSNIKYWSDKIDRNKARDRKVNKVLREQGWSVLRIWEHQIRDNFDYTMEKIVKFLK